MKLNNVCIFSIFYVNFVSIFHINICYLMLDFYVKTRIRFSLRDKRLFEITEVEVTRVDCIYLDKSCTNPSILQ